MLQSSVPFATERRAVFLRVASSTAPGYKYPRVRQKLGYVFCNIIAPARLEEGFAFSLLALDSSTVAATTAE